MKRKILDIFAFSFATQKLSPCSEQIFHGDDIMEYMNNLWIESETIADRLEPFEGVIQLVRRVGTYKTERNEKGAYVVKKVVEKADKAKKSKKK